MHLAGTVLAALFVIALGFIYWRDRNALKERRLKLFEACLALFDNYQLTQDAVNFPVLTGSYGGFEVRIEPLADHVVFRKIPSLWLLVTVKHALPVEGTFDLLARAQNVEFYSPADSLQVRIATPDAWPRHTTLRADRSAAELPMKLLDPHVRVLFGDPRSKELVVTRRGVRIVYQAHSGDRSEYLVMRSAAFREAHVPAALLRSLLDQAVAMCVDLAAGGAHARG
ncbi:hypothetical protein [Paraburkholderia aromaticivorans]|uniref:hypothetical protein n=1 Tax=Paraburkholderia aromaticivorans TaxID=2026199 RepID=UPI001455FB84|nr:hypothetical protein [Paraburkholderia aromaticivorans]